MNWIEPTPVQGVMTITNPSDMSMAQLFEYQQTHQDTLEALLNEHGAILYRGFGVNDEGIFADYMALLPQTPLNYIDGNSPRTQLSDKVYTSTEFPAQYPISMHNELSYSSAWPSRLYFCCVTPAQSEGHTLLADCRKVLADLDPQLVAPFAEHGVRYSRFLHGGVGVGPSWQQTFETDDKAAVEQFCLDGQIQCQWLDNGGVQLLQQAPGTLTHPVTAEQVWFNQADQFHPSNQPAKIRTTLEMLAKGDPLMMPTNAFYGDGSEIADEVLDSVRATFERHLIRFDWQKGDLLWVDNVLMAHGRSPFSGERKILVAMTK